MLTSVTQICLDLHVLKGEPWLRHSMAASQSTICDNAIIT